MGIEQGFSPEGEEDFQVDGGIDGGKASEEAEVVDPGGVEELPEAVKEKRKQIRKQIESAISEVLKEANTKEARFRKKGSTWRRAINDIIQVVHLQRGRFAYNYYLEVAVFRNTQDSERLDAYYDDGFIFDSSKITIEQCHDGLRTRLPEADEYLNLDKGGHSDDEIENRIDAVKQAMLNKVVPMLKESDSVDKIQEGELRKRLKKQPSKDEE